MDLNDLTYRIIGCAYTVHKVLGPGLLESAYEACLQHELLKAGLEVERQKVLPLIYDEMRMDVGYRIDLLVNNMVILELKSVDEFAPITQAQLMTYLKLSGLKIGLLLNFNVKDMKKGIRRIIL